MRNLWSTWLLLAGLMAGDVALVGGVARAAEPRWVGVARVDVTPTEPIRLTGYAARKGSHEGVEQRLWAKALVVGTDAEGPLVWLTLDNCGIAEETWREVRGRLGRVAGIRPDRVVLASSHTHSGPATRGWAPNIFVRDLTADEQGAIDRYTDRLLGQLEQVVLAALADRRPGRLSWAQGSAGFAANRRTRGGPVDQALPVLKAEGTNGAVLAVVANYACHCTTLGGEFNRACGDWAGYAQEAIERAAPGAVALVTVGCGADANPSPRGGADGGLALARRHGEEVGGEVRRLLALNFTPLTGAVVTAAREVQLPYGPHFTRAQWEARSTNGAIVGYHARRWLARLDRGEPLPESLWYPITTWRFGTDLALVFLPGEVVVDYALRLKRELDAQRLWVTAYANYVPCYIPSRRILTEGGYEAEDSLWYYDRPARLSPRSEDLIVETVRDLLPGSFKVDPKRAELPEPREPEAALGTFRLSADLRLEQVASEPLVQSPVAIDWDAAGRLWVCEMRDYPTGMNPPPDEGRKYGEPVREPPGGFTPGGRVKILTDQDGDGRMDRAELFLDGIPFPTGVMPWGRGALVCAAPHILYAEDTDGDGRADRVQTNVTGFATHNYQARVNGFRWGLDGWLHGSSGLFGGKARVVATGQEVDLGGRDFRYRPETNELEPVSGISQLGRVRDDFDEWYGNDNSTLLWHYPLSDRYLRRNRSVTYPEPRQGVARGEDSHRVYPVSRTLTRFNDPQMANLVTSACGPELYRGDGLGMERLGEAYICEPVHNLVRRLKLSEEGGLVAGRKAEGEERGEFLASTDNWFRPVQARTGPDGALYIVDMYRFVIEHPRWIPPERLRELDVRAGAERGRIYRVTRRELGRRPVPDLGRLAGTALARALETPVGPVRDWVQRELVGPHAADVEVTGVLEDLAGRSAMASVRAQAVATLAGRGGLAEKVLLRALSDGDSRVRRVAVRAAEPVLRAGGVSWALWQAMSTLGRDADPLVRRQLALSLGESPAPEATAILARMALAAPEDRWLRAAVLSSAVAPGRPGALLDALLASGGTLDDRMRGEWVGGLVATVAAAGSDREPALALSALLGREARVTDWPVWRVEALARFMGGLRGDASAGDRWAAVLSAAGAETAGRWRAVREAGLARVELAGAGEAERRAWIRVLAALDERSGVEVLGSILARADLLSVQEEAVVALGRSRHAESADKVLAAWGGLAVSVRVRAVDALLARAASAERLAGALVRGEVGVGELSLVQRQRLLERAGAAVPAVLRQRLMPSGREEGGREALFRRFAGVGSLTGVAARGEAVFDRLCASCHLMRGRGHEVGPNLAEFAGKSVDDFLLAILDPNAAVNPNHVAYDVELRDGRSLAGVVRNETASGLTVVQGGGVRESVLRRDVVTVRAQERSLMPEGLGEGLSPDEMADLVAWIKGGAVPVFGAATAAQAGSARSEFARQNPARDVVVERAVERLPYPSWLGRWPLAYCRQAAGQERLLWRAKPGTVTGDAAGGTALFRFPAGMGFHSQAARGFVLRVNGAGSVPFEVALSDREWFSGPGRGAGGVRMSYLVREAHAEDSCGVLEIEVPRSMLGPDGVGRFEVTGTAGESQRWFGIYLIEP